MTTIEAASNPPVGDLWLNVEKLARLRWVIFVTGFKRARPGGKLLYLGLLLLIALVSVGTYLLTTYLLGVIKSPVLAASGVNLLSFVKNIPGLVLTGAFAGILVCSFGVLLQALYLANDMQFLLTTPIPIRAVFLGKLLQAILPNFVLVAIFCLPMLFSLGFTERYSILYFPVVLVVLLSLSLAAAGISSLLVMAVVRFIPARRVAEVLAFVAAISFMLIMQWQNLFGTKSDSIFAANLAKGANGLSNLTQSWSPLSWGGRGLVALGEGNLQIAAIYLGLTFSICLGVFWLALTAAEKLYYSGWASVQASPKHKKAHRPVNHAAPGLYGKIRIFLPSQLTSIMFKDFRLLLRDLRSLSQLIMPLIMGIVFAIMLLRSGAGSTVITGSPAGIEEIARSAAAYGSLFIPLFVGWTLVLNVAVNSFSMEGRSYWMLKSAPLSSRMLLGSKFLVSYLPALLVAWVYTSAIALLQHVPYTILLYALASDVLVLLGMVGINLSFGVRYANLDWSEPRHMTDGPGSYLAMIGGIVYLILCSILFIALPVGLPMLGISEWIGQVGGLLVGGAFALACMVLTMANGLARVGHLGEQ